MSLIDASYFVAELNIPNTVDQAINERVAWTIQKYEPDFLQKLLGYPLYKAFVAGLNVTSPTVPDIRWTNLLYGAEYTDWNGYAQNWKGLIVTDTPVINMTGGFVYKKPQYLIAGISPDFAVGVSTETFTDWIGWTPIIVRNILTMVPGVDYSYDKITGIITLLTGGDYFGLNEVLSVQFELRTDPVTVTGGQPSQSCIANYVYYWYMRSLATQTTGTGEMQAQVENAKTVTARAKMVSAWNEMSEWVKEMNYYLQQSNSSQVPVYPEWTDVNKIGALRYFNFMNPFF